MNPEASEATQNSDFEIGIICALPLEALAVKEVFQTVYSENQFDGKEPGDSNSYTKGSIGQHRVVLAHLPGMGKVNAAAAASTFKSTFRNLKLVLLVGICGGVPEGANGEQLFLGDVVIGTSVVQTDFGRQTPTGFDRKDTIRDNLRKPPPEIGSFIAKLESDRQNISETTLRYLAMLLGKPGFGTAGFPGAHEDKVLAGSPPKSSRERSHNEPSIHFGAVASSDLVMKSGTDRDRIAKAEKVIAFEMEAAGVWDQLPTLVAKGVSDYADCHKNDMWKEFASASAWACTKAVIEKWEKQATKEQYRVVSLKAFFSSSLANNGTEESVE
jgi:nucleoside phosphorylase